MDLFDTFIDATRHLQRAIATTFEAFEDTASFQPVDWVRPGGGGGTSLQLRGTVFEKAAIGHSHVHGDTNPLTGRPFRAGGLSLIFHPSNPHAPAVHMNLRRFDEPGRGWFGGVVDLNPMGFTYDEDAEHFHAVLQEVCTAHHRPHAKWAQACLEYYRIPHRRRNRGVGGIYFDHLETTDPAADLAFMVDLGGAFERAYLPIIERRHDTPHDEADRQRQLVHRGYYTEFNLVYDEGTRFGFESGADPIAVLSSMPPLASW